MIGSILAFLTLSILVFYFKCFIIRLGQKPVEAPYIFLGQTLTCFYFLFFILVPLCALIEDGEDYNSSLI